MSFSFAQASNENNILLYLCYSAMNLDEDLEELDIEVASSDEDVRHLRQDHQGNFNFNNNNPFSPGRGGGGNSGGPNSFELKLPRRPDKNRMPRAKKPKGWNKAFNNRGSGRHYHGFWPHPWCHCYYGHWYCLCLDHF